MKNINTLIIWLVVCMISVGLAAVFDAKLLTGDKMTVRFATSQPYWYWFPASNSSVDSSQYFTMFLKAISEYGTNAQPLPSRVFSTLQDGPSTLSSISSSGNISVSMNINVSSQSVPMRMDFLLRSVATPVQSGASSLIVPQGGMQVTVKLGSWPFTAASNYLQMSFDMIDGYLGSWTSVVSSDASSLQMPAGSFSGVINMPQGCFLDGQASTVGLTYSPQGGSDRLTIKIANYTSSFEYSFAVTIGGPVANASPSLHAFSYSTLLFSVLAIVFITTIY